MSAKPTEEQYEGWADDILASYDAAKGPSTRAIIDAIFAAGHAAALANIPDGREMADLVDKADQRNQGEAFASRESFGRHLFELITDGAA